MLINMFSVSNRLIILVFQKSVQGIYSSTLEPPPDYDEDEPDQVNVEPGVYLHGIT